MHGFKRIFVFCLVTTLLPALVIILPLWLRHSKYADVHYKVAESDILEIRHGISSIFCQKHSLRMNTTFNAFQLNRKPKVSEIRKHIRLRKSMILPDDTLEYWGFYLLKGATVSLKVCSRYDGSRILVVKGDKDLKTCGLLEHNKNKFGTNAELGNVFVTFETNAEVIDTNLTTNHSPTTPPAFSEDEEGDGLGKHFDVPKIRYSGEDDEEGDEENTAAERDDNVDFALLKKTTTTTRRTSTSKERKKSKSGEALEGIEFTTLRSRSNEENKSTGGASSEDSSSSTSTTTKRSKEKIKTSEENKKKQKTNASTDKDKGDKEAEDEDDFPLDAESWTEYVKLHRSNKQDKLLIQEIQAQTEEVPGLEGEEELLTPEERKVLEKYLKKIKQRTTRRTKRDLLLETKVNHGGTALNFTEGPNSNSVSSFENNLLACYDGQILLAQTFPPSTLCRNVKYLEQGSHMVTTHEITSDGYYYYIFYSDNDNVKNDINALFDIHKPTFLYANISDTSKCYNSTNCSFPIEFLTDEVVIVEVPTRDGIEHEGDDFTVLISTCHPRMGVYVIFPIAVLFLILTCAFL